MTRRRMLRMLDAHRIEESIRSAERSSAIEVRVSVAGLFWGRPRVLAERAFVRLGMSGTERRTGVLFLLAPWYRQVVVLADEGIRTRVGDSYLGELVAGLSERFRHGDFSEALAAAIERMGRDLAAHFPPPGHATASDKNELPDTIDRGR